jgi:hypothetical protein
MAYRSRGKFIFSSLWTNWEKHAQSPFALIKDHVLLPQASVLAETDTAFKQLLTPEVLEAIVNLIPEWLQGRGRRHGSGMRDVYLQFY